MLPEAGGGGADEVADAPAASPPVKRLKHPPNPKLALAVGVALSAATNEAEETVGVTERGGTVTERARKKGVTESWEGTSRGVAWEGRRLVPCVAYV